LTNALHSFVAGTARTHGFRIQAWGSVSLDAIAVIGLLVFNEPLPWFA
jgi:hypothetical protein